MTKKETKLVGFDVDDNVPDGVEQTVDCNDNDAVARTSVIVMIVCKRLDHGDDGRQIVAEEPLAEELRRIERRRCAAERRHRRTMQRTRRQAARQANETTQKRDSTRRKAKTQSSTKALAYERKTMAEIEASSAQYVTSLTTTEK